MEQGLTYKKNTHFSKWYKELILKADLIKYYDVAGCYILLPDSYSIWESIKDKLDREFKTIGVKNAYFPIFITQSNLEKEKSHIEGFSPEVAWVTHSGDTKLDEKIAIRPTSETAIYSTYSDMIRTYRDLPLKMNQWANVVRWEFKDTMPFIRSREFLWQEGHTCYSNKEDAIKEMTDIITIYKEMYRNMCVPTIKGYKTEKEKFDGAEITTTLEAFIPEIGKGIQACTSHYLGTNFSKMFNIKYKDDKMKDQLVHQNSWGFTTRSIGIMLMTHSDDKGLVIPPNMIEKQIIILPIYNKKNKQDVIDYIDDLFFSSLDLRNIHLDDREDKTIGWKMNYWELKGIPIRLEIGIKEVNDRKVTVFRRDLLTKETINYIDTSNYLAKLTKDINNNLYEKAKERLDQSIVRNIIDFNQFKQVINNKIMALVPFCGNKLCEQNIKDKTKAKSLCIPTDEDYIINITDTDCIHCDNKAKHGCLFGKSY